MLHRTITAPTCNVLWLSVSCGTCLRVCHHSGVMNGCGCNLHQLWLQHRSLVKKVNLVFNIKPSGEDLSTLSNCLERKSPSQLIQGCCLLLWE